MKFILCMLSAVCLLFAGCGESKQTKSDDRQKLPASDDPQTGQIEPGPNQSGGVGDSGSVEGRGTAGGGSFDPAATFKASDADGDEKLTGDEISGRMEENLEAIDTDKDGAITLEEHQEWVRKRMDAGGFGLSPGGISGGTGKIGGETGKIGGGGDFRTP